MESLGHPPFSVLWNDGIGLNKNRDKLRICFPNLLLALDYKPR